MSVVSPLPDATPRQESGGTPLSLELETIRRAADGDRRAQAWVAGRLIDKVRTITRAVASNAADADDAAQLALMEILRSLGSYRGESSLEHWAGRITVRHALRYLGRERRHRAPVVDDEPNQLQAPFPDSKWQEALPRHLREYLELIAEPQRIALILHHALGYSLDEVAELTDVSPNTVKSRLRLGAAALRKLVRREVKLGRTRGES